MSVKDSLKQWVDELSEEEAARYLERVKENQPSLKTNQAHQDDGSSNGSSPPTPFHQASPEERRRRVQAARGSAAHLNMTVEDLHRNRREELALEEEQSERRRGGIG